MKRRKFIKGAALASLGYSTIPMLGFSANEKKEAFDLIESLTLKDFEDEQEELPSLVTDGYGQIWMFSLRRMSYPEDAELVAGFQFYEDHWKELDPVTASSGQFEAPMAACAPGGKPIVAWTEIKGKDWVINASQMNENGFPTPHSFEVQHGKSINPILIAPDKDRNWIAWEQLHKGVFSICVSKYENQHWSEPIIIEKGKNSCFDPAIAEAKNGDLYISYGLTAGFHQNIELAILDGNNLRLKKIIPVAIGGGHKDRVNINARPALAFDAQDNLWISYESNRNASRYEDGDNYTGDRCCSILSYQDGNMVEIENKGKWLFQGENDHKPTFIKNSDGNLFLATHCGGNFTNHGWKYRLSWLDPKEGWQSPVTIFDAKMKGLLIPPAIAFDEEGNFWLATNNEKTVQYAKEAGAQAITQARLTELNILKFTAPQLSGRFQSIPFAETQVKEYLPDVKQIGTLSGHPKMERQTMTANGETYTLLYGNLHEHSNSSNCWPAGMDGSLHEDYRFGMFTEGYDFVGMTDHAASTSEILWRKNLRLADFYTEFEQFIAIPAVEWTLQSDPKSESIQHGAGHYNIIFASTADARKYIRNKHELFSPRTPESAIAPLLWKMLDEKQIHCVTIPHHPADEIHPVDWNVTDPKYVSTVEIFQCRGNNEYPGCPRERNLSRHTPTTHKEAFIDHALRNKKHKMGFIASGDHNSMGIGLAALWVKEVSRDGIIEALQNRRCFATTGDKLFIDFRVNEAMMGRTSKGKKVPELAIKVVGQYPLEKVDILRNSKVIHSFDIPDQSVELEQSYSDLNYEEEKEVLYYYIRATQKNKALAWSSPVWVED